MINISLGLVAVFLIGEIKIVSLPEEPETLMYDIIVNEETVGMSSIFIERSQLEGKDAIRIFSLSKTEKDETKSLDSTELFLSIPDLRPLLTKRSLKGAFDARVEANYSGKKVEINLDTPMGKKSITLDVPLNAYDNEEIIYLFRFIELTGPKEGTFLDIVPLGGTSVEIKWKIRGEEKIKIGEDEYDTYIVELNLLGRKVEIYYEKTTPRRMVKYIDKTRGITMLLRQRG